MGSFRKLGTLPLMQMHLEHMLQLYALLLLIYCAQLRSCTGRLHHELKLRTDVYGDQAHQRQQAAHNTFGDTSYMYGYASHGTMVLPVSYQAPTTVDFQ